MPSFDGDEENDDACTKYRYWWAFLVSSVATFLLCILAVCTYRLLVYLCCQTWKSDTVYESPKAAPSTPVSPGKPSTPLSPTPEEGEVTWMTEAKDWAGELISGQTTTGRILVSPDIMFVNEC